MKTCIILHGATNLKIRPFSICKNHSVLNELFMKRRERRREKNMWPWVFIPVVFTFESRQGSLAFVDSQIVADFHGRGQRLYCPSSC